MTRPIRLAVILLCLLSGCATTDRNKKDIQAIRSAPTENLISALRVIDSQIEITRNNHPTQVSYSTYGQAGYDIAIANWQNQMMALYQQRAMIVTELHEREKTISRYMNE